MFCCFWNNWAFCCYQQKNGKNDWPIFIQGILFIFLLLFKVEIFKGKILWWMHRRPQKNSQEGAIFKKECPHPKFEICLAQMGKSCLCCEQQVTIDHWAGNYLLVCYHSESRKWLPGNIILQVLLNYLVVLIYFKIHSFMRDFSQSIIQ